MAVRNREKDPSGWRPDIEQSVAEYDKWYLRESPSMFADARGRAVWEAADTMRLTEDFRSLTPAALMEKPAALLVARMAVSPPMARDRLTGFTGASKSLVATMECHGRIPARARRLEMQLGVICGFLRPLLDPSLFLWVGEDRAPTAAERDKALLVVGDRVTIALYLAVLRSAQEARQKELLREYLEAAGFEHSGAPALDLPAGTFGLGRNVHVERADGKPQNLPVDCVAAPLDPMLPLACIELKSAGDYTNVNKRRKEEAAKQEALKRTYGERAVFLLQLFGYFDPSYLGFEAAAGIDWAWDHRLEDLAPYLGVN